MIIIRLTGGLGNQLFQYALGKHIALINNSKLYLDLSGLNATPVRDYELKHFNIDAEIARKDQIEKVIGSNKYSQKITKIISKYLPYPMKQYVTEQHSEMFHYLPGILELRSNVYIDGYWQNQKYFNNISEIIRKEFTTIEKFSENINEVLTQIQNTNSISIHVRRGDYILPTNIESYQTYGNEYINKAIEYMLKITKDPHFYFFSDDIKWVKENIPMTHKTTYVSLLNTQPHEDLILMSKCCNNIIANSSFSWWAAWLNSNKEKIVIVPKIWLNNPAKNTDDLIPIEWIKL